MKSQGNKAIIAIIIVAILAGGYLYWKKSQRESDYKDDYKEGKSACIQVITRARNPQTGEEKDFGTPCDVPEGWVKVEAGDLPAKLEEPSLSPAKTPEGNLGGQANKTYKSSSLAYEVQYPGNWGYYEQSSGAFVEFGPGKVNIGDGTLGLDLACVYASGFEEGGDAEITHQDIIYGVTTYDEHKIYIMTGGKKELAARFFEFPIPQSNRSDSSCSTGSFIVKKDMSEDILKSILSSLKFN